MWSFEATGSFSEVIIYDLTALTNLTIVSGDSFSTIADHTYKFSADFYDDGSTFAFNVTTVPTPAAIALIGIAGMATRRRRT